MTTNVAIAPPTRIAKPRYNASFGAIGKLLGKQNVTRKNVEDIRNLQCTEDVIWDDCN